MYPCAFCSNISARDKWFVCPSTIFRPNMYSVCEEHVDLSLNWNDVYPTDGCKPITRHEHKVNG